MNRPTLELIARIYNIVMHNDIPLFPNTAYEDGIRDEHPMKMQISTKHPLVIAVIWTRMTSNLKLLAR